MDDDINDEEDDDVVPQFRLERNGKIYERLERTLSFFDRCCCGCGCCGSCCGCRFCGGGVGGCFANSFLVGLSSDGGFSDTMDPGNTVSSLTFSFLVWIVELSNTFGGFCFISIVERVVSIIGVSM